MKIRPIPRIENELTAETVQLELAMMGVDGEEVSFTLSDVMSSLGTETVGNLLVDRRIHSGDQLGVGIVLRKSMVFDKKHKGFEISMEMRLVTQNWCTGGSYLCPAEIGEDVESDEVYEG